MNNNARVMKSTRVVSLLAIVALLACASPAAAAVYNFSFLPDQSSVMVSGGFAGISESHSIQGDFQMTIDFEALTASFDQVNASLSPGGAYDGEHDLGTLFYMTELVGSVAIPFAPAPTLINFQGQSHGSGIPADYIDCLINMDGSLQLTGSFNDGYPDGFQYDLNAIAMPEPATPTGDFNGDGDVDGVDFAHWQIGYPTASGASLGDGDADGDGDVDGVDFGLWQANYPTNLGGSAMTPEPATLALLLMGGLALAKRRRK